MPQRSYSEEEIQDLTDRVFLLKEQLEAGKMRFASHLIDDFRRSYEKIRLRPDGRVDPSSVDGRIRASTLALAYFKQREEAKEAVSLSKIQSMYFEFLFREFGWFHKQMLSVNATPAHAAAVFSRDDDLVKDLSEALPDLAEALSEFWAAVGDAASYHLQDGRQLKATFAGDLFPAHWENAVSTAGLYVDTIILPCPITRIAPLNQVLPPREVVSLLLKHTLTAMGYRELATVELDPPLVLVVPNSDDVDTESRDTLVKQAIGPILKHAEYLFGRQFESIEHIKDYCDHLGTSEQVIKALKGGDRLIFDCEWESSPEIQLSKTMALNGVVPGLDKEIAGHHVLSSCLGRMPQAKGAQLNAMHFGGTPLINAETSWLYYTWLLEYEGTPTQGDANERQTLHVVRALAKEANKNLEWLGNVPPAAILEIRKAGLAEEVRALLGNGVSRLVGIDPNNYFRTADQVIDNLDRAFREHHRSLMEAKQKKLKLYGIDVAACVAVGGVAVAAALTGHAGLGAVSGVLGVAGLPNLKDIKTKFSEIAAEDRARRASPTGLLFRHVRRRL